MKPPWIQCPSCMGHGQIPLSRSMLTTLEAVKKGYNQTAIEILERIRPMENIKISAIHNRLVFLERNGLVKRVKKVGTCWRWV